MATKTAGALPVEDHGFYDNASESDDGSVDQEEELAALEQEMQDRKGKTLAAAFGQVMEKPRKGQDNTVPILAGRKRSADREEEEEEALQLKQKKKVRQEMRKRGHLKVPRRGQDPSHDVKEKAMQKLATKGVVKLFNAVAKAQQGQRDAEVLGKQKIQQSKADFFSELKGGAAGGSMNGMVGQLMAKAGEAKAPGWSVLRDDFDALQGGTKMKDWDRQQEDEAGLPDEQLDDMGGDDDDDDDDDGDSGIDDSDDDEDDADDDDEDEFEEEEEDEEEDEEEIEW